MEEAVGMSETERWDAYPRGIFPVACKRHRKAGVEIRMVDGAAVGPVRCPVCRRELLPTLAEMEANDPARA